MMSMSNKGSNAGSSHGGNEEISYSKYYGVGLFEFVCSLLWKKCRSDLPGTLFLSHSQVEQQCL